MGLTCYECGREIPAGRVERRPVKVGAFGGQPFGPGGMVGVEHRAEVPLCPACLANYERLQGRYRDRRPRQDRWAILACLFLTGILAVVILLGSLAMLACR